MGQGRPLRTPLDDWSGIHVLACEYYVATGSGGREHGVREGYRGAVAFEGAPYSTSGEREFLSPPGIEPGECGMVRIRMPLAPLHLMKPFLKPGQGYKIQEGSRVVGYGVIVEVSGISP